MRAQRYDMFQVCGNVSFLETFCFSWLNESVIRVKMDSILSEPFQSSPNYCTGLANEEDAVHLHIHVLYIKQKVVFCFSPSLIFIKEGGGCLRLTWHDLWGIAVCLLLLEKLAYTYITLYVQVCTISSSNIICGNVLHPFPYFIDFLLIRKVWMDRFVFSFLFFLSVALFFLYCVF